MTYSHPEKTVFHTKPAGLAGVEELESLESMITENDGMVSRVKQRNGQLSNPTVRRVTVHGYGSGSQPGARTRPLDVDHTLVTGDIHHAFL